jgi:enterobactin synthetase component D
MHRRLLVALCQRSVTKCKRHSKLVMPSAARHTSAMNPDLYHPACCGPLQLHWPLPQPLPGCQLVSCTFTAEHFHPDDFARCAIAPTKGLAKRQTEFLAGRLCARQALQQLTGTPTVPAVGADRAPCWPPGVVGSISHGDGWALALVGAQSHWRGLGVDIERLMSPARAARLQASILTPAELARLAQYPQAQQAWLVSLTFSLKESLFKALYPLVQQRFYFHDAELLNHSAEGAAQLQLLRGLGPDWPAGSQLSGQFAALDERLLSLVSIPG